MTEGGAADNERATEFPRSPETLAADREIAATVEDVAASEKNAGEAAVEDVALTVAEPAAAVAKGPETATGAKPAARRKSMMNEALAKIGKDTDAEELDPVAIGVLLQYATTKDKAFLVLGMIFDACAGGAMGVMLYYFGDQIDGITGISCGGESNAKDAVMDGFWAIAVVAGITLVCKAIAHMLINLAQKNQMKLYRTRYMYSIIRQDVGWYDVNNPQQLSTAFGDALTLIEKGLGMPVWGQAANQTGTFAGSFIVAFIANPAVAGISCVFLPVLIWIMIIHMNTQTIATKKISAAYAQSGGIASEALGAIRTVAYLGIESIIGKRYTSSLTGAMKAGISKAKREGFTLGGMLAMQPLMTAVGYMFGAWLMTSNQRDDEISIANACVSSCNAYDLTRLARNKTHHLENGLWVPGGSCTSASTIGETCACPAAEYALKVTCATAAFAIKVPMGNAGLRFRGRV